MSASPGQFIFPQRKLIQRRSPSPTAGGGGGLSPGQGLLHKPKGCSQLPNTHGDQSKHKSKMDPINGGKVKNILHICGHQPWIGVNKTSAPVETKTNTLCLFNCPTDTFVKEDGFGSLGSPHPPHRALGHKTSTCEKNMSRCSSKQDTSRLERKYV